MLQRQDVVISICFNTAFNSINSALKVFHRIAFILKSVLISGRTVSSDDNVLYRIPPMT